MSDAYNFLRNDLLTVVRDHKLDAQRELSRTSSAEATLEALKVRIARFQQGLKEDEELGACFAFVGQAVKIRVRAIEYEDPTLIVLRDLSRSHPDRGASRPADGPPVGYEHCLRPRDPSRSHPDRGSSSKRSCPTRTTFAPPSLSRSHGRLGRSGGIAFAA